MELYIYWLLIMVSIMISVSFLILLERKVLGAIQVRKGPNISVSAGLLHSFSDAVKLLSKGYFYTQNSNLFFFLLSPMVFLFISLASWSYYPFGGGLFFIEMSLIYFLVWVSLSVFPFVFCGWSSNSKYSFLGSVRTIAQVLSYEISMFIIFLGVIQCTEISSSVGMFKFQLVCKNFMYMYMYLCFVNSKFISWNESGAFWFFSESVGVSFSIYGGILFTWMFLSEYMNIVFLMSMYTIFFIGLYLNFFFFFFLIMMLIITIVIRGCLPRYRYDKLMILCWLKILPLSILFLMTRSSGVFYLLEFFWGSILMFYW
uniref:NADH dehydrogenase subunit 1 n=1 Tax=Sacculina confragosa TaxID=238040 RepID=UPI0025520DC8|nr:NADH dehydrogenase subunit 1 [Sacculina confragosa]WGU20863.1 NADH dehydrogenase subunit 1 [Sacculina confragosa]